MSILTRHPLSAAFPDMSEGEYAELCKSIADVGLLNPIVIYEGMIIDGWHRYCACVDEMVATKTIELASDVDPQKYVIAQNKDRRHLTQSQIATAAIKVYEWLPSGVKQGSQACSAQGAEHKSAQEIAEEVGVSVRTVEQAKQVAQKATEEVKEAVAKGEMSVSTAVKKMAKPKAKKEAAVKIAEETQDYSYDLSANELEEVEVDRLAREHIVEQLFNADDPQAEVAQLLVKEKALNIILQNRMNGLMNENAALARTIQARDRQIAKLKAGK